MPEYKAGHAVKVTNPGCTYASYTAMFHAAGFKNKEYNGTFKKGTTAIIKGVYYHPETGIKLYALEQGDKECIVDEGAIKLWDPTEDLFEFCSTDPGKDTLFTLNTSSAKSPLMIGYGLVPTELQGKCLVVDTERWSMNVEDDWEQGLKILTFKRNN